MTDDSHDTEPGVHARHAHPDIVSELAIRPTVVPDSPSALPTEDHAVTNRLPMEPGLPTLTGEPIPRVLPPSLPPQRYEVGREIARGGMGRVVEASDTTLGRVVALKEALSTEADALRRFQREIKITARLEHPSIVPVHDAGNTSSGTPFYVMRKVSGRPLEELVATSHALGARLALIPHIVASAQAVAHAHLRGIVHRDIKPSNILVGDLGETIVIDWGLAKEIDESDDESDAGSSLRIAAAAVDADDDALKTRVGVVFGTPGFMAPEQLQGAPVDERCDVYALGATLYHLLTRKPPHHAKTADLMMRAAVDGPPTPVGALVGGVPPELATIVDKALALDPEARYQTAKSLAEDLQRFLTGKLIASHHYTATERLVRFVRRNRVPVIAVTAATLALIVGGTIAVRRVVDERDRADDQARVARTEKLQAEQRADQLTLTQARYNVDTNPTLAVAMTKPLALKYWREVRAIGAAARAAGVAFSLPASANTLALQLTRDGRHAIASGEDGIVRSYDLVARTSRELANLKAPVRIRLADGERTIVAFAGAQITILDATTGAARTLVAPAPISDLEVSASMMYWVDLTGALWQRELAGDAPVAVKTDESIREVAPSPDGRWIALLGEAHLWLLDRTRQTDPILEVVYGSTKDVSWTADGAHLGALVGQNLIEVEMATLPLPQIVHRIGVGQRFAIAFGGGQLYTVGPTGVSIVSSTESVARRQLAGTAIGIREARGGTMIVGAQGNLAVLSDDGDRQLSSPVDELITMEASPRSPYVVAAAADRLLVWNLDELQPRQVTAEAPAAAGFVGGDQVIASFVDAPARWIDLATGKAEPLGMIPAARAIAAPPEPHPQLAALIDLTHHAHIVAPGHEAIELAGDVDLAGFVTPHQIVLATVTGAVRIYDTELRLDSPLRAAGVKLDGIGWSRGATGGTIAAAFDDGTLWRYDLATRRETIVSAKPSGSPVIANDGSVIYAEGSALHAWRADGKREVIATLPRPIADLGIIDTTATVFTNEGTAYVVDLASGMVGTSLSIGGNSASMSADTGLVVTQSRGGALDLIDPVVKQKWTLAPSSGLVYTAPQISADGRRVLALTRRSLLVWTMELPTSAPAMPGWLAAMTNATVEDGELTWR